MNVLVSVLAFAMAIGSAANLVAMAGLRGRVDRLEKQIKLLATPFDKEEMTKTLQDAIARWAAERVEEQA